jgi:hypothetical protein
VFKGLLREFQLPVACSLNTLTTVFLIFLPVVEVTYEIDVCGIGSPLTEYPALGEFMKPEIKMTRGKIRKGLLSILC